VCPGLRISGQLQAPIVSGREDKLLKMEGFPALKGSWPWPWIGSYCIPSCITYRLLRTCQISLKSKKNFL